MSWRQNIEWFLRSNHQRAREGRTQLRIALSAGSGILGAILIVKMSQKDMVSIDEHHQRTAELQKRLLRATTGFSEIITRPNENDRSYIKNKKRWEEAQRQKALEHQKALKRQNDL
mmetsp:Transcript_20118/g.29918  ORF Transcript_20118/g.29918 Transcript_20118/m.29918 type:complete len:116 (+) Transcript_20118:76-423(+)